ncbi:MAG: class I SAM-dependent methyltransferase [Mycobacteriaceae bacterium]|uniref:class I SAM-dependent methyltransferase n=1 Tax=Corynebacterium sp. TaxID=1720 RepID=UPI003F9A620D
MDDTESATSGGLKHLDVGCGTGTLVASAVTRGREVTGIDTDADMAAVSQSRVAGTGANIHHASVLDLPFPDASFDAVTANFVVNHLPDPRAGLREMARVLEPGGPAAMTIWPAGPLGWSGLVGGAFDEAGVTPLPPQHLPEHLDFERSVAGLAGICMEAGLEITGQSTPSWTWRITPGALWRGVSGGVAGPGRAYLAQMPEARNAADQAFLELAEPETMEDGQLHLPMTASYVLATLPEA